MAGGGSRKRHKNQRPDPIHHHPEMVHRTPPHRCTLFIRVVSILLAISILVHLTTSSTTWFGFIHDTQKSQFPKIYTAEIVNVYPHDRAAFTQGLLYDGNDTLYESTGLYGRSSIRRVALKTGKVEVLQAMEQSLFGEGLTLLDERLYQVTWLRKTGFIYDKKTLSELKTFTHQMNDGWGLATDGKIFFGSDGSSTLYQIDPHTMKLIQKHTVRHKEAEVRFLNELEYVNGEVWANVYMTDCIARIVPGSGVVSGWILLPNLRESLIAAGERDIDVLNGIAWDGKEQRIFVTGKLWPKLYEIKLHQVQDPSHYDIDRLCVNIPNPF